MRAFVVLMFLSSPCFADTVPDWSFKQGSVAGGYAALARVVECMDRPDADFISCVEKVEMIIDHANEINNVNVECRDGTVQRGGINCSGRGGVKQWLR